MPHFLPNRRFFKQNNNLGRVLEFDKLKFECFRTLDELLLISPYEYYQVTTKRLGINVFQLHLPKMTFLKKEFRFATKNPQHQEFNFNVIRVGNFKNIWFLMVTVHGYLTKILVFVIARNVSTDYLREICMKPFTDPAQKLITKNNSIRQKNCFRLSQLINSTSNVFKKRQSKILNIGKVTIS